VQELVHINQRMIIRKKVVELGMDKLSFHQIFIISLGMKKVCVKMVPKYLTDDQQLG
jgi:hypothetical protein